MAYQDRGTTTSAASTRKGGGGGGGGGGGHGGGHHRKKRKHKGHGGGGGGGAKTPPTKTPAKEHFPDLPSVNKAIGLERPNTGAISASPTTAGYSTTAPYVPRRDGGGTGGGAGGGAFGDPSQFPDFIPPGTLPPGVVTLPPRPNPAPPLPTGGGQRGSVLNTAGNASGNPFSLQAAANSVGVTPATAPKAAQTTPTPTPPPGNPYAPNANAAKPGKPAQPASNPYPATPLAPAARAGKASGMGSLTPGPAAATPQQIAAAQGGAVMGRIPRASPRAQPPRTLAAAAAQANGTGGGKGGGKGGGQGGGTSTGDGLPGYSDTTDWEKTFFNQNPEQGYVAMAQQAGLTPGGNDAMGKWLSDQYATMYQQYQALTADRQNAKLNWFDFLGNLGGTPYGSKRWDQDFNRYMAGRYANDTLENKGLSYSPYQRPGRYLAFG